MSLDLTVIPENLATRLGLTLFPAQILCSLILITLFMLPILLLTRGKNTTLEVMWGTLLIGLCCAIQWLPIYFLLLDIFIIAGFFGLRAKGWFS